MRSNPRKGWVIFQRTWWVIFQRVLTLSLVEKIRNIFAVDVGRYTQNAIDQRVSFNEATSIWDESANRRIAA